MIAKFSFLSDRFLETAGFRKTISLSGKMKDGPNAQLMDLDFEKLWYFLLLKQISQKRTRQQAKLNVGLRPRGSQVL